MSEQGEAIAALVVCFVSFCYLLVSIVLSETVHNNVVFAMSVAGIAIGVAGGLLIGRITHE